MRDTFSLCLTAVDQASCSLCISVQLQMLYKFIEQKGELRDLGPLINSLTKQKTAAVTQLAKQGLKDLEELTGLLKILGVKIQVQPLTMLLCLYNFSDHRNVFV